MWIDANDCIPLFDGDYRVKTANGKETIMSWTHDGGWNTFISEGGHLIGEDISDFVTKWFNPLVSKKKAHIIID